ncbi:MAG: hypothetical protein Q8L27_00255 [archaeon]|nr:hypothetical protein [archaeon]
MVNLTPFSVPYESAFVPEHSLLLPIQHLLGNKIALFLKDDTQGLVSKPLDISYWKFEKTFPYTGRVHISPKLGLDLGLFEDLELGKTPNDYPKISERTTNKEGVNISFFYPCSRENWNFRIHYTSQEYFVDRDAKFLIAHARISQSSMNSYDEGELDKVVYNPPLEVVQIDGKRWITKPN